MATLFHDPHTADDAPEAPVETPTDPGTPEAEAVVEHPCASCGAALAEGQEYCLECGTPVAAGGARGGLPGWRTAAAVIAVTLVMASGAVAAAYAAIRSDDPPPSDTIASAGPFVVDPPGPIDIPAEEPAATTPAPAPADGSADVPAPVSPPAASAPLPTSPAPVYTPPTPVTPVTPAPAPVTPSAPSTSDGDGKSSGEKSDGDKAAPVKRAALVPVTLDPQTTVASAYNPVIPGSPTAAAAPTPTTPADPATTTPADPAATTTEPAATGPVAGPTGTPAHAASDFPTEPKAAYDGDPATFWSVTLPTPELVAQPHAGLLIDLQTATKLRRLTLTPTTPGTTIVVYGANTDQAPGTIEDKGWKKLATQLDVDGKTNITLGDDVTGTGKVRQLLIWFEEGPDDGTSTSVGISELKLYR